MRVEVVPGAGRLVRDHGRALFTLKSTPDLLADALSGPPGAFLRTVGISLLASGHRRLDGMAFAADGDHVEILLSGSLRVRVSRSPDGILDPRPFKTLLVARLQLPVTVETIVDRWERGGYQPSTGPAVEASAIRVHLEPADGREISSPCARYVLIDERSVAYEVERAAVVGRGPTDEELCEMGAVPITIDAPAVSRTHIACIVRNGLLLAKDLKSKNGSEIEYGGTITPVGTAEWSVVPSGATLVLGGIRLEVRGVTD